MASTVAQPLEREFSEIPGLVQMTSKSALGSARITLQFSLDRDIDAASLDVQAAISDAAGKLPRALPNPPSFRKINPAAYSILILALQFTALPLIEVKEYTEPMIAQQISR